MAPVTGDPCGGPCSPPRRFSSFFSIPEALPGAERCTRPHSTFWVHLQMSLPTASSSPQARLLLRLRPRLERDLGLGASRVLGAEHRSDTQMP